MKGYVYVLSNPAMPGMCKIGRSCEAGLKRASQLYRGDTGVPLPFVLEFECLFDDCIDAEAEIHAENSDFRVNDHREFFYGEPEYFALQIVSLRFEIADNALASIADCIAASGDNVVEIKAK